MGDNNRDPDQELFSMLLGLCILLVVVVYLWPTIEGYIWLSMVKIHAGVIATTSYIETINSQASFLWGWVTDKTPANLNNDARTKIDDFIAENSFIRWLGLPLLGYLSYAIFKKRSAYLGLPDINSLLKTEHKIWPALEFVKRVDPHSIWNELKGLGRYDVTPLVFAIEQKIIPGGRKLLSSGKKDDFVYDKSKANAVFEKQLLGPFTSYMELTGLQKTLVTLSVAKDMADDFGKFDDIHRLFALALSNIKQKDNTLDSYLNSLCNPLMRVLDGTLIYGNSNQVKKQHPSVKTAMKSILAQKLKSNNLELAGPGKYLFKDGSEYTQSQLKSKGINLDVTNHELERKGLKKNLSGYLLLSNHSVFFGATFTGSKSKSSISNNLINELIQSVLGQHFKFYFDDSQNVLTTYKLFRTLPNYHAYNGTILLSGHRQSKRFGKHTSGRLTFFRHWDRSLAAIISATPCYKANNFNTPNTTYIPEALGVASHYFLELYKGARIDIPSVDTAVDGLQNTLIDQNIIRSEIEELEN
jgi:hypothetical protein